MLINVKNFKKEIKKDFKKVHKAKEMNIKLSKRLYGTHMYWCGVIKALEMKMFSIEEVKELKDFMMKELRNIQKENR